MVINQINIMDNFSASYEKILKTLQMVETKNNFLSQHRTSKLSDIELIALSLTGEFFGIDSECQLFRIMRSYLKSKIERSVYNRRRKRLFFHTARLHKLVVDFVSVEAEYFIVDSMPVEISG